MKMSVRFQVLGLIAAVLVVAMGVYLPLAARLVMRDKLAYVYDVESALVRAKSDEVYGNLASLSTKLAYFAETGAAPSRNANGDEPAARALVGTDPDLLSVEIWRKDGVGYRRICRYVEEERVSRLGISADLLPGPVPGSEMLAQIDAADGLLLKNASLPPDAAILTLATTSSDGAQVIVANLHPDRLLRLFDESHAYQAYLIDASGNVLLHPDPRVVVSHQNVLDVPIVRDAIGGGLSREVKEYGAWVGAFSRVGMGGLAVVTVVPRAVAWSAFEELAWRSTLFAIAVVLASFLVAIFFSRRLAYPLVRLEEAAAKLSRGELGVSVPVTSRNEIGRLAEAFNRMSRELGEREQRLKEAQARLIQSDRLATVGTLAAGVAHEINNPLTYINANLKYAVVALQDAGPEAAEVGAAIHEAILGAERVKSIVADLRLFSRRNEDETSDLSVPAIVEAALKMVAADARRRAAVETEYEDGLPPVLGNPGRLGQVFLNLLVNAVQALPVDQPDSNTIRIRVGRAAGGVKVEISDTGSGIPPEALGRIYDPFFTTKPHGLGTGLGLSICHGIVTSMGGTIEVASQPGKGSTFTLTFPGAKERKKAPLAVTAAPEKSRVLVVDDDPAILTAIRTMLGESHDVVTTSGSEALDLLLGPHVPFDVVLVDLLMPDVSGMDLYHHVRRELPGYEERMVFMTGGQDVRGAKEFLEVVPNPRIAKPFGKESLEAALAEGRRASSGSLTRTSEPRSTGTGGRS